MLLLNNMPKIILYNAISVDGFIAKPDGDSEWVSEKDGEIFEQMCKDTECIIIGRRTFDQYYEEIYPMEGILNVVLTHEKGMVIHHTNVKPINSVQDVMTYLDTHRVPTAILVGGGGANESFLMADVIDEIIVTVHPIILGCGIKLFGNAQVMHGLNLIESKELGDGLVQMRYTVNK